MIWQQTYGNLAATPRFSTATQSFAPMFQQLWEVTASLREASEGADSAGTSFIQHWRRWMMKEVEASRWTFFSWYSLSQVLFIQIVQLPAIWTGSSNNNLVITLFAATPAPVLSSTIPPQVDIFTFLRKLCPGLPGPAAASKYDILQYN